MIGFNDRIGSIASFRPWADHFRPTPEKQTFSESVGMSQRCHFRTHAPQQFSACLSKDFDAKVENRTDASDLVRHILVRAGGSGGCLYESRIEQSDECERRGWREASL